MVGIQVAQFGLFLVMLEMATLLFANTLIFAGVGKLLATGDAAFALKMTTGGLLCVMVGFGIGAIGKLLCLGAPEDGARKLIVLSVVCDIIGWILKFSTSGSTEAAVAIYVLSLGSLLFFLAFLARMGDNVDQPKVRQFIGVLYGLFAAALVLPIIAFFAGPVGLLLLVLDIFLSLGLYTYTLLTLLRAMPLYVEEVKAGIIDPTVSAEARAEAEKKARREGPKKTGVSKVKVAEAPKGEPPVGALLYRIPKHLEPIHVAVKEGDRHKLELCLSQGVSPMEPVRHGLTPLHIAASVGVMDVADALLVAGADVDATCEEGLTPLFFAVQTANPYIAGLFLTRGANVHHANSQGLMPIHWACCAPHNNLEGASRLKMVETLVEHGADLTARTKAGKTPRDLAEENELKELVVSIDRQLGTLAPPAVPVGTQASEAPSPGAPPSGMITTESGATVAAFRGLRLVVIPNNLPDLHAAVKDGDPEKVERQLAGGAAINDRIEGGIAPIHITAITGVMSVSQLLLRYGADVNDLCDYLLTPMFLSVVVNNVAMVGFMRSRGANIDHRDEQGRTPLHWAAGVEHEKLDRQNRLKMVNFLIENGADPTVKDDSGMTAAQIAVAFGHEDVAAVLQALVVPEAETSEAEGAKDEDEYYV